MLDIYSWQNLWNVGILIFIALILIIYRDKVKSKLKIANILEGIFGGIAAGIILLYRDGTDSHGFSGFLIVIILIIIYIYYSK